MPFVVANDCLNTSSHRCAGVRKIRKLCLAVTRPYNWSWLLIGHSKSLRMLCIWQATRNLGQSKFYGKNGVPPGRILRDQISGIFLSRRDIWHVWITCFQTFCFEYIISVTAFKETFYFLCYALCKWHECEVWKWLAKTVVCIMPSRQSATDACTKAPTYPTIYDVNGRITISPPTLLQEKNSFWCLAQRVLIQLTSGVHFLV